MGVSQYCSCKIFRQVFALRGEALYLVNTRIENTSGAEHEYSQFFALPFWVPATKLAEAKDKVRALREAGRRLVIEDSEHGFLATSNSGRPNISRKGLLMLPSVKAIVRRRSGTNVKGSGIALE